LDFALEFDPVLGKRIGKAGINANSREMRFLILCRFFQRAGDRVAADCNILDGA
jgi:hypothetical protein